MIIKEIIKNKSDYLIIIDDKEILVDENTIVKLNLYVNKEIDSNILDKLYNSYYYEKNYKLALNYSLKYNKSKKGVYFYLIDKMVEPSIAYKICEELEEKKVINDYILAKNYLLTLINKCYGRYMIINKLKSIFIPDEVIDDVINLINYEDYYIAMNKYVDKNKFKYDKYQFSLRKYKIYDDLKKRGYSSDDISNLSIE